MRGQDLGSLKGGISPWFDLVARENDQATARFDETLEDASFG